MGAVYLASHQFFERKAALKVLHPHLCGDENSVRRFMNEARAANAIRHPNIIEVRRRRAVCRVRARPTC